MARAALDWTQHDLAKASGVSWRTITRFEAGDSVLPTRVQKLRHLFQQVGVLFVESGDLAGAVVPPRRGCTSRSSSRFKLTHFVSEVSLGSTRAQAELEHRPANAVERLSAGKEAAHENVHRGCVRQQERAA